MELIKVNGFDVIKSGLCKFDDVMKVVQKANQEKIGGFDDWVFPDTQTLRGLALLNPEKVLAWSSSPYVGYSDSAWYVNFYNGYVGYVGSDDNHVRLVRASQCLAINQAAALKSMQDVGIFS